MKEMKRYWSVILLGARGVTGKLAALLAALTAAETVLVAVGYSREIYSDSLNFPYLSVLFRAALMGVAVICCLWGSDLRGNRCRYTLGRLRVSEMTIVVLWGLCYALAFLTLMGFQLVLILGIWRWVTGMEPSTPQALFLASYRSSLFHALLPIEDWGIYLRNAAFALMLGLTCSAWAFWRRRNVTARAVYAALLLVLVTFPADIGAGGMGIFQGCLSLIPAAAAMCGVWKEVRCGTD